MNKHEKPGDNAHAEGPAGYGINKPDGAEKMPVKHYPESSKGIPKNPGKGGRLSGPCEGKEGY